MKKAARQMRTVLPIAACLIAAAFAAPVSAQEGQRLPNINSIDTPDGSDLKPRDVKLPPDPVGAAEELRLSGRCNIAVPALRLFAEHGVGNEIAQFNLGMCLLDFAAKEHDAKPAGDMRQEGAQWIVQAANGGFGKAQAQAVVLYLDGTGVAVDPAEADKWALLYHDNGMRISIGMPDIGPAVKSRLDAALTDAMRAQGRSRADSWKQTAQASDQ
jgi:TPR repeat protein